MSQRIIDQNEQGQALLAEYLEEVRMVSGMVEEAFVTNPTYLLSPYMRKAIADRGKKLQELHLNLKNYICIDWIKR